MDRHTYPRPSRAFRQSSRFLAPATSSYIAAILLWSIAGCATRDGADAAAGPSQPVAAHSEPVGGGAMPAGAAETPSLLPASCERMRLFTVGGTPLWQMAGQKAFFFTAGLAIDAEGAPDAYHPNDTGRDILANAGRLGNWWALVTDTGTASGAALPAHFG